MFERIDKPTNECCRSLGLLTLARPLLGFGPMISWHSQVLAKSQDRRHHDQTTALMMIIMIMMGRSKKEIVTHPLPSRSNIYHSLKPLKLLTLYASRYSLTWSGVNSLITSSFSFFFLALALASSFFIAAGSFGGFAGVAIFAKKYK